MDKLTRNIIIILFILWLFMFLNRCQCSCKEGFMPDMVDLELSKSEGGSSNNMGYNGSGTYFKELQHKNKKGITPYVFTQILFTHGAPQYPDNFATSIQHTGPSSHKVKVQRTDGPHSGWGQNVRFMVGKIYVKGQDPNTAERSAY
jgi:hypothetical protein